MTGTKLTTATLPGPASTGAVREGTFAYVFALLTQLTNKAPSLVAALLLARLYSEESMGTYFVASAVCFLAVLLTGFGTNNHLVRSVAGAPDDGLSEISRVLALRLPLTVLGLLSLNIGAYLFLPGIVGVMLPVSIFVLVGDFANTFGAYLTGRRLFGLRFVVSLAGPVALVATMPVVVYFGATLQEALFCFAAAGVLSVVAAWAAVRWAGGPVPPARISAPAMRRLMLLCWPLVALEALQVVQFKIDVVMVYWLVGAAAAAQYETAYRLLEVSRVAARPLATSVLPICAYLIMQGDQAGARSRARYALLVAILLGLGPVIVGLAAPEWAITTMWGPNYADAAPTLRVLLTAAPLVFVVLVGVMLAVVVGRERRLMVLMALAGVFNVGANLVMVPIWGEFGAACTTVATEALIVAGVVFILRGTPFAFGRRPKPELTT